MRLIIAIGFLTCLGHNAQAQIDTAKIERYCMVVAQGRMMSNKVNITIDYGEETKFWSGKDQRVKDEEGKLKKFNSVIDALNFMSNQGWKLHSTMLLGSGPYVYHYVFRKEFLKSEFAAEATSDN